MKYRSLQRWQKGLHLMLRSGSGHFFGNDNFQGLKKEGKVKAFDYQFYYTSDLGRAHPGNQPIYGNRLDFCVMRENGITRRRVKMP